MTKRVSLLFLSHTVFCHHTVESENEKVLTGTRTNVREIGMKEQAIAHAQKRGTGRASHQRNFLFQPDSCPYLEVKAGRQRKNSCFNLTHAHIWKSRLKRIKKKLVKNGFLAKFGQTRCLEQDLARIGRNARWKQAMLLGRIVTR